MKLKWWFFVIDDGCTGICEGDSFEDALNNSKWDPKDNNIHAIYSQGPYKDAKTARKLLDATLVLTELIVPNHLEKMRKDEI